MTTYTGEGPQCTVPRGGNQFTQVRSFHCSLIGWRAKVGFLRMGANRAVHAVPDQSGREPDCTPQHESTLQDLGILGIHVRIGNGPNHDAGKHSADHSRANRRCDRNVSEQAHERGHAVDSGSQGIDAPSRQQSSLGQSPGATARVRRCEPPTASAVPERTAAHQRRSDPPSVSRSERYPHVICGRARSMRTRPRYRAVSIRPVSRARSDDMPVRTTSVLRGRSPP